MSRLPEVDVDQAGDAVGDRGGRLRLLHDVGETERSLEPEVVKAVSPSADDDPGPRQTESGHEHHEVEDVKAQEPTTGHGRSEARTGERRVAPEVPLLLGE